MDEMNAGTPVAHLYVADRERALGFYRDVLGLTLKRPDAFGDFLDLGGALLRMTVTPGFAPGPHPVLGWNVADIGAAVADLTGRGVAMLIYDGMGQDARGVWTAPDGATQVAFFADPDGNVLSLSQTRI